MIHVLSLGAGVQSSTLALMAAAGEITPMPTAAIFADTQAEPQEVYRWLDWLEKQLPFPVIRATKGDITQAIREPRLKKDGSGYWVESSIPAYVLSDDGSKGMLNRQCTQHYKIEVITKETKRLAEIKRGEKEPKVTQWIGISLDEVYRMKPSREKWQVNRWPLIEARMTRAACLAWMERKGYPKPPRSACVFCPFKSNAEWRHLKETAPEEFARAVEAEKAFQAAKEQCDDTAQFFLHSSRVPLDRVNLSTVEDEGQMSMFNNECTGMCGV